ncbi:hypothetical protein FOCG_05262 [Fusarium oxysporum f. sp. radicis-lycopersici 26381]|uniref:Uncharacterized protein n=1 Tax=Fusarium oxysporum Fo47 TaxID=660027 RepID=W9JLN9_FUSOX|nr:hypothetical protein FOZG_16443 [Fusarium oxysporum Fo47]EXL54389.1 hypothetical protein FOCG_05262 [Fusarium oxysporum f. sp. radicis-lycopersici 26381]
MQSLAVSMGIVTDDAAKSDKVALNGKGKFPEERYKILKGSMKIRVGESATVSSTVMQMEV